MHSITERMTSSIALFLGGLPKVDIVLIAFGQNGGRSMFMLLSSVPLVFVKRPSADRQDSVRRYIKSSILSPLMRTVAGLKHTYKHGGFRYAMPGDLIWLIDHVLFVQNIVLNPLEAERWVEHGKDGYHCWSA